MSRRRKSTGSVKKSKDEAMGSDKWSEEEKTRLLDALKEDDGKNNWRWIARKVNTKTMAQVKQFAERLNREKRAVNTRSTPSSNKRPIAPKDNESLEGWVNATKRLRGDDDVDGTCIPQSQNSRARESKDSDSGKKNDVSSTVKEQHDNSDKVEGNQQDPVSISDTDEHQKTSPVACNDEEQAQWTKSIMEDLLTNQKEMMQKISLLESKLENLRSDDTPAQSSVMDVLVKINSRLDSLSNNTPHGCCGGPVIIQTTPHANVVHQPILDSCSSCSDAKQDKQYQTTTVSDHDKESIAIKDGNNTISTKSLSRTSIQTLSNPESISTKNNSSDRPPTILVLDSQEESSSKSQTISTSTQSPEIASRLSNIPIVAEPSVSTNKHECSVNVSCVPGTKPMTSISPTIKQLLPEKSKEQFSQQETSAPVVKESGPPSNLTRSVALIVNQSPTKTTTASTMLLQTEVLTSSRQQRAPLSESGSTSVALSQQTCATPYRETECLSHVGPVQITPVSLLQPSFIDLQSTLTASPVLSTVVRSPTAKFVPVGMSPETSRLPQQPVALASSSITAASLQQSISGHTLKMPLHRVTTTSAEAKYVPPGFITLSRTTNVLPSPNKIHGTLPFQPQTIRTTSRSPSVQGKDLHLSPAAGAVIQKAANDASAKQKLITSSPKEIMNAAILISNYITEHPNPENQAQWQSCLSAIVTDYHKNLDPSRGDLLKLVSIGYNPYVVLTQFELEDMLEKSKGRPKFFALRLAEKLYGIEVLMKSTPYGIGGKAALHPEILDAIKVEVLRRFAADMSNEGQTLLWKSCVTSIAQRCKRARNPRKGRSAKRISASGNGLGSPSMAIGGGMQCNEHEENDDSQEESDEQDDEDCEFESVYQPVARHTPPPLVRIPSDEEQEPAQTTTREDDGNDAGCITLAKDSSTKLESFLNSSAEKHQPGDTEQDIPPGIDPDITVVHLPSNLQASVERQTKQRDQRQSPVAARTDTATTSCHDNNLHVTGAENRRVDVQQTGGQKPSESEGDCCSKENDTSPAGQFHGDYLKMVQRFPNPGASIESVIVSGIKMTPDYSHVLVGGNPNVVIPRQKYLDALTKSSQPTHFSVRLAELIFGDDVLEASTVTGGKRGTMQLDPVVINSIQAEVIDRFLKTLVPEQQSVVWRKCVTSIATRCKTLRYNRTKTAENHWTVRPSQTSTE